MKHPIPLLSFILAILLTGCSIIDQKEIESESTVISRQSQTSTLETLNPVETPTFTIEPTNALSTTVQPVNEETMTSTPPVLNSNLQLTFLSHRECKTCLYGRASGLYAMDVGCLDAEIPCFGEAQLLFEWDKWISEVDWSPDGSRLVFESEGNLFIADWNGKNVMQIPSKPGSEYSPQWSPDGKQIAFIGAEEAWEGSDALGPSQIRIFDLETGDIVHILNNIYAPHSVYWLPDGEMAVILKTSETDWVELINIIGIDRTVIRQLPENASDYTHIGGLAFSPDMQQLAFVGEINPITGKTTNDVYVMNMNGSLVNLTDDFGHIIYPAWSPFGDWIAFDSNMAGDFNIYLIKPDGTHLEQLTDSKLPETFPSWRIIEVSE